MDKALVLDSSGGRSRRVNKERGSAIERLVRNCVHEPAGVSPEDRILARRPPGRRHHRGFHPRPRTGHAGLVQRLLADLASLCRLGAELAAVRTPRPDPAARQRRFASAAGPGHLAGPGPQPVALPGSFALAHALTFGDAFADPRAVAFDAAPDPDPDSDAGTDRVEHPHAHTGADPDTHADANADADADPDTEPPRRLSLGVSFAGTSPADCQLLRVRVRRQRHLHLRLGFR
jgi:hypothetical protein